MNKLTSLLIIGVLESCSLFHSASPYEMEQLSSDVLQNKSGRGISITIIPIEEAKK